MRKEQVELLYNISRLEKNQSLLLQKPKSPQIEFFQLFGQRYLLTQNMMHRHVDDVLSYLPGSFANIALYAHYLNMCLENRVELNPEQHPLLKRLIEWSDLYIVLKEQNSVRLVQTVMKIDRDNNFTSFEQFMVYLSFIGGDIAKLVRKQIKGQQITKQHLGHLEVADLLDFLLKALPKVLFNIILSADVLPPQYKSHKTMQVLYRSFSYEHIGRSKQHYALMIKILIKMLLKFDLKTSQQRTLIEIVFRYFYCYHYDKKYNSTDIFIQAYNKLDQSVRFAMADQFILFFKVARKIGKSKFVDFLIQKSSWLRDIDAKISFNNLVGYSKQILYPFPNLKILDVFNVPSGKSQHRTFQVLQDYSLIYFLIQIQTQDITIKLHYLGDFEDKKSSSVQLLCYQKKGGLFKANIMAVKKGIYQLQFDNSYSWMNSKTIKLQKIVLSPIQFQSTTDPSWLDSYFQKIPANEITNKKEVYVIEKIAPKSTKVEDNYSGTGSITLKGTFYNMKIKKGNNLYEFQSENQDLFVQKFNQIIDLGGKIRWIINGQLLQQPQSLPKILHNKIGKDKTSQRQMDSQSKKQQTKEQQSTNIELQKQEVKEEEKPVKNKEQSKKIEQVPEQ